MNRLVDSLTLFEEICNSQYFTQTSMILFLNKRDLFQQKLAQYPLEEYFPEIDASRARSYEHASEFIRQLFLAKNRCATHKVYTHLTCATGLFLFVL